MSNKIDIIIKQIINEAVGVMENPDLYNFAKYLWKRCKKEVWNKPSKLFNERNFTIPSKQWAKYNPQNLSLFGEKIQISLVFRNNISFDAAFDNNHGRNYSILMIGVPFLDDCLDKQSYGGEDEFISVLMHELTHAVNTRANAKSSEETANRFGKDGKIRRIGATRNSDAGMIEYLFTPTEMNARLTQAYYYLIKLYKQKNNDRVRILFDNDEEFSYTDTEILKELFKISNNITKIGEMKSYLNDVYKHMDLYKSPFEYFDYQKNNGLSFFSKLRIGKTDRPSQKHTFNQFKKRQFDIAWELQKEYDKFKKRIYKMLSKFIYDVKSGKIEDDYGL